MKIYLHLIFVLSSFHFFSQCALVVSTNADAGAGSLRAAITAANSCAAANTPVITFNISASSTITLFTDLPSLTHNNTTIDATTALGYAYPNAMITLDWTNRDDCIQINSGNNDVIKGLNFTNNFNGSGDAAIRANGGANLLVQYCKAFKQNKNLVRVQGATNVVVDYCTVRDFWYNGGNSQKAFEVNSGSLIRLSNCNMENVSKKVIELNNSASGGSSGKVTIRNNVFTNVGYGDSSVCSPTPCGMNKGEFVISSYASHTAVFSIRNNTLNGSFSKFIEIINSNGTATNRDSIYNNAINNCRGQHVIYIESNSGSTYGGAVIQGNSMVGDGINTYNLDQVIEIGGWANNYSDVKITSNTIRNFHGRAIMFRSTDNSLINNNVIYNCSKDQGIELNNNCDNVTIQGNYIGTDSSCNAGLSHFGSHAIQFNECNNCKIGGNTSLGYGNVIVASNNNKAIEIGSGCSGTTTIRGNKINTNLNGTTTLSNSNSSAIQISGTAAIIGGDSLNFRNIISGGSGGTGIEIGTPSATIQGSLIGCRPDGSIIQGNALQTGIRLNSGAAIVGSTSAPGSINKIGYCQRAILNSDQDNNEWSSNQYWGNTNQTVIDNDGSSPNNNVASPVITSIGLPTTVSGTGVAGARVEVYFYNQNFSCQGYRCLGFTTVASNGTWTFISPVTINQSIAALQINASNASEFACSNLPSNPPPTANFSMSSSSICAGDCISLTDLSFNNPLTYNWTMSGGSPATSSSQNPSVCYTTPGTYTLNLTVSNTNGTDNISMNVVVLPASVSTNQIFSLCQGENVTVGTSVYSMAGNYTDTLVSSSGCDSIITTVITVIPPLTFSQSFSICPGETITVGNNVYNMSGTFTDVFSSSSGCDQDSTVVTIVILNANAAFTQSITICEGESVSVADSVYNNSGTYTNVIVASNGCDSTITTILIVEDCSSGISEGSKSGVLIYPNPTQDLLTISSIDNGLIGSTYQIIDQTGRLLLSGKLNATSETITTGSLACGVYSLVLGDAFHESFIITKY